MSGRRGMLPTSLVCGAALDSSQMWPRTITHVQDALHFSSKISVTGSVNDVDLGALHAAHASAGGGCNISSEK